MGEKNNFPSPELSTRVETPIVANDTPETSSGDTLPAQVENILSNNMYADKVQSITEKIALFPEEQAYLLQLLQRGAFYKNEEVIQAFEDLDDGFGAGEQTEYLIETLDMDAQSYVEDFILTHGLSWTSQINDTSLDFSLEDLAHQDWVENLDINTLQQILSEIQGHQRVDDILHNTFATLEIILGKVLDKKIDSDEKQVEIEKVQVETEKVQAETKEEKVTDSNRDILNALNSVDSKYSEEINEIILKHSNIKKSDIDDELLKKHGLEKFSIERAELILALKDIAETGNTQAIQEILQFAAQADPKGVEGETFQAFYTMFERSGVNQTELQKIRLGIQLGISNRKINMSSVSSVQDAGDIFVGAKNIEGEVKVDGKGNLVFQNQKLDLSEVPPTLFIQSKGSLEIRTNDKDYYKNLFEKNTLQSTLTEKQTEYDDVKKILEGEKLNLEDIGNKIQNINDQINSGNLSLEEEISLRTELQDLELQHKEAQRIVTDLEKQAFELQTEIEGITQKITHFEYTLFQQKLSLESAKKQAQDTANYLDNMGFTHIPKSDIDWIVSQVNLIDASYYGFSKPLNFENGFDYQSNKGYREFTAFFNTLIYGKDVKNHTISDTFEKFTLGRDTSRTTINFQQTLKEQGVLREDGSLNKFNFHQKFRSRVQKAPEAEVQTSENK